MSKIKRSRKTRKSGKTTRTMKIKKYTDTYFIDACYNIDPVYDLSTLIRNLKKLGLEEDSNMDMVHKLDIKYLNDKHVTLKKGQCYQDHRLPNLAIISTIRPKFMFNHIHSMDKRFYKSWCMLSNVINFDNIKTLQKHTLYFYLRDHFPEILKKHMKPTFYVADAYNFKFPKIYILRPFLGSSGAEIFYVSNEKELDKALDFYYSHNDFFKRDKWYHNYRVVATEYIMNPLLYKTKKFHLRMYYIISILHGKLYSFFLDIGKILTAAKPYNTKLPFSKDVHDSHLKSTIGDIMFPEDFTDANLSVKGLKAADILEQMRTILAAVTSITMIETRSHVNPDPKFDAATVSKLFLYDNQENGYNVYGVDFMIDDTGRVILIEINGTPGMEFNTSAKVSAFCNTLFNWINDCVLEPCFKGTDPTKQPTYLIPTHKSSKSSKSNN